MMHAYFVSPGWAVVAAVLAALSFALWNIYLQRALERGATPTAALLTMDFCIAGAALPFLLGAAATGGLPPFPVKGLLAFAAAGFMTSAVAPFHTAQATRRIGAAQTTALRLLDPLFALVLGLLFLREQMSMRAVAGVGLVAAGLGLLQLERRAKEGARSWVGIVLAVGASFFFTAGSVMRKVGLGAIPSPVVATAVEGLTGVAVLLPVYLAGRPAEPVLRLFSRRHRDLWYSGLGAAAGTFFLNLALQGLPVPVAVALRNTSPWFALLLVPLILGSQYRPGRWTWISTVLLTSGMLLILSR